MAQHIKVLLLAFILCLPRLGFTNDYSFKPDEIMPLNQVKPGMKGYGKTVFKNTEIEKFDIEVVGIIKNWFSQKDVILIRCHHPVTDLAGIIHGMSGSPIYIDGKVIGALAYGFSEFPKDPLAGVTPIEYMLNIETNHQKALEGNSDIKNPSQPGIKKLTRELWNKYQAGEINELDFDQVLPQTVDSPLTRLQSPLMISGLDPSVIQPLNNVLHYYGFIPAYGGSAGGTDLTDEPLRLEPGSSVGGRLVTGDIDLTATGTVTYRDDDKILGFGHSFFSNGKTNIAMCQADVITVVSDQTYSYKLSNKTTTVGNIIQDEIHGIFGKIGGQTPMIETNITHEINGKFDRNFHYQVIRDDDLTPFLMLITFLQSMVSTGAPSSDRTLDIQAEIKFEDYPSVKINDRFSGDGSIYYTAFTLLDMLGLLADNPFVIPKIKSIDMKLNSVTKNYFAEITNIWYNTTDITPGDKLQLTIAVKPWRNEPFIKQVEIDIPDYVEPRGLMMVQVGSGRIIDQFEQRFSPARNEVETMDQLITKLNQRHNNKNIYVRLLWQQQGAIVDGQEMPALPPFMRKVMGSRQVKGYFLGINDKLVSETEIPIDYLITDFHRQIFRVQKSNSLK